MREEGVVRIRERNTQNRREGRDRRRGDKGGGKYVKGKIVSRKKRKRESKRIKRWKIKEKI